MRHRKSGRQLNRNSSHRKAMFKNMASSLFEHEVIKTTLPKAKELRRVAEPLITLAKEDSVSNRRLAFARLRNKDSVKKLFESLGPRFKMRPGGYVRILKAGFRKDDNAPMAIVELVQGEVEATPAAPAKKDVKPKAKTKAKAETKVEEAPVEVKASEEATIKATD